MKIRRAGAAAVWTLDNLDARLCIQMDSEFRALQQHLGITSLHVTHDQKEAMTFSDRVVVIGRPVLQIGTLEMVRHDRVR